MPGFSSFLGTGGQGHGAGDAPRGCGVETRGPGLGSQPGNASTHLYIYTYLCIYIYTHSYIYTYMQIYILRQNASDSWLSGFRFRIEGFGS